MTEETTSMDLNIQIKEFEKQKEQARKVFNKEYPNDEKDSVYMWEDLWLDYSEEVIEGNTLKISGGMKTQDNKDLGYFNMRVPLDFDKLIEIFQSYIKKLQKVKNVMESVKDE
ncbi:MAG TPA: hypothetical protein ENI29_21670 [bacterium]|nr:hypothetical protein [bacterium]